MARGGAGSTTLAWASLVSFIFFSILALERTLSRVASRRGLFPLFVVRQRTRSAKDRCRRFENRCRRFEAVRLDEECPDRGHGGASAPGHLPQAKASSFQSTPGGSLSVDSGISRRARFRARRRRRRQSGAPSARPPTEAPVPVFLLRSLLVRRSPRRADETRALLLAVLTAALTAATAVASCASKRVL